MRWIWRTSPDQQGRPLLCALSAQWIADRPQHIGRHGAPWTPDTARNEARRLLGIVANGFDPYAQVVSGEGFPAAIDRYLERKRGSLKPNSFRETERYRLAQIDRRKIAALLGDIETASGAVSRNRARSALSGFFAWCVSEGLLETNPVTGTAKANENGGRERVLTHDELKQLWRTLPEVNASFADIVRLLLLTGQRRNWWAAME